MNSTTTVGAGPPNATPAPGAQQQALAQFEHQGQIVEEYVPAVLLHIIAKRNLGSIASAGGFKKFLDKFVADCGGSKSPITKILTEQLVWSHFAIGNLLAEAATAKTPDLVAAFSAVAARLMSEARKTGLAIRNDAPSEADASNGNNVAAEKISNIELTSNPGIPAHVEHTNPNGSPNCRPTKPNVAKRAYRRGASTAA